MQKSNLPLNNKLKTLEEEVEFWKNKHSNSLDESVRAKNASKVELQTKTDKIKSLEEEIEKINAHHEKVLDKKQITLDSLGNTISSQKKDIYIYINVNNKLRNSKTKYQSLRTPRKSSWMKMNS